MSTHYRIPNVLVLCAATVLAIGSVIAWMFFEGFLVMLLWNALLPRHGLPTLGWYDATAYLALARIVFGRGFRLRKKP